MSKGGLSFLNKKSWHTGTLRNHERVWQAEQRDKDEKRKTQQLLKEIQEERRAEDLRKLQVEAGLVSDKPARMNWMEYGPAMEAEKSREEEEYLLGKPIEMNKIEKKNKKTEEQADDGKGKWIKKYETRDLDVAAKIREDPLLMMMSREKQARMDVVSNPMQMRKLKTEVERIRTDTGRKKSSSSRRDTSYDEYGIVNKRSSSPDQHRRQRSSRSRRCRREERYDDYEGGRRSPTRHKRRRRNPSSESRSRTERRRRSRYDDSYSPRRRDRRGRRSRRDTSPSPRRERRRHHRDYDDDYSDEYDRRHNGRRHERTRSHRRNTDSSGNSNNHRISEEEKQKRLKEMMQNAEEHDKQLNEKISRDRKLREKEHQEYLGRRIDDVTQPKFIQDLNKEAFLNTEDTMEDRLNRNRHFRQRGRMEDQSFM